jgi:hypothetical protein
VPTFKIFTAFAGILFAFPVMTRQAKSESEQEKEIMCTRELSFLQLK